MSPLASLASPSSPGSVASAVLLGVACHLTLRPYEIDNRGWQLVALYLSIFSTAAYFYSVEQGVLAAIIRTTIEAFAFNTGLTTSLLIYRGLFHSLRRFPGPFPAKFTRFYTTINVAKRHGACFDMQAAHQKYGDFVRIGPRELSINRSSAIPIIYGSPTVCTKSPSYSQVSDDVTKISVLQTRDLDLHRKRRRAWERGLSFRAISAYESRVKAKADLLLARLDDSAGEPLDISKYAMFFGFDVMGDIGFSKDFGMLQSGIEHPAARGIHENMEVASTLGTVPWLLAMLGKIPGAMGSYIQFAEWCGNEVKVLRKSLQEQTSENKARDPQDVMSWLLRAEEENDASAPPGEGAFQEDARLLVIAGSDTTSAAIANALFYLATNPGCYRKLVKILQEIFPRGEPEWSYEKVKAVPYLEAIIQETLRLKPSAPAGLTRLTPASGLAIDGVAIPGDVVVSVPVYTIQRDARYWGEDALDFVPERWEALSTEKTPWIPFTKGPFTCPGKGLAFMELRMALSRIALCFDLALASERDGEIFDQGAKDVFTMAVPALPMKFIKR